MEIDLTIIADPLNPTIPLTPTPSNLGWEVMVVLTSSQLSQNLVLSFEQVNLQSFFQQENNLIPTLVMLITMFRICIPHPLMSTLRN